MIALEYENKIKMEIKMEKRGYNLRVMREIGERMEREEREELETKFKFLDGLRESGVTNMFGATPYLKRAFPDLKRTEASDIIAMWMLAQMKPLNI